MLKVKAVFALDCFLANFARENLPEDHVLYIFIRFMFRCNGSQQMMEVNLSALTASRREARILAHGGPAFAGNVA